MLRQGEKTSKACVFVTVYFLRPRNRDALFRAMKPPLPEGIDKVRQFQAFAGKRSSKAVASAPNAR